MNEKNETERAVRNETARMRELTNATWSAGIGAFGLVSLEFYKLNPRWMPLSTVFYLLLIGGAIGIMISIIMPNLGEKVKIWLNN